MFLFKNSKNKVTRIGLNLLVYSFVLCMVLFCVIPFIKPFPEALRDFIMVVFCCPIIAVVMFIVGCFLPKRSGNFMDSKFEESKTRNYSESKGKCELCGYEWSAIKEFNGKKYCYSCECYYSSKFNIKNGKLIEKKTGDSLLKEVVIYKMPLSNCRGDTEPTDFIIRLYDNKVEVDWGVGWCGGYSHADGAGNTEVLDADYFNTHTIEDFVAWFEERGWGKDFVKWFDIANNPKICGLFNSSAQLTTSVLDEQSGDVSVIDN